MSDQQNFVPQAALDQHHGRTPLQLHGRHHIQARFAIHLAIVQKHRLLRDPAATQHDATVQIEGWISPRRQGLAIEFWQCCFGVDAGLQGLFLGRTRQLPAPQRQRNSQRQQGDCGDQPEFPARIHEIIESMKYLELIRK